MISKSSLSTINVTEITSRLPGPLAGSLFVDKGFDVHRIEWIDKTDAFKEGLISEKNPLFKTWYQNINKGKTIHSLSLEDQLTNHESLKRIIEQSDILILSLSSAERDLVTSLIGKKTKVVINLVASEKEHKFLHDLNALAQSGLLNFDENKKPPPIPYGGVVFSAKIVIDALCALLEYQAHQNTIFLQSGLEEAITLFLEKLIPTNDEHFKALHNGKFPCYQVYKIKDGNYVALAAIEEHFWHKILNALELPTNLDRFDTSGETHEFLQRKLAVMTRENIDSILGKIGPSCLCLVK